MDSAETRMSLYTSSDSAQTRMTSAPHRLTASSSETTLPSDFDIFSPTGSSTQPCVITARYGGSPCSAIEERSDDWNHPRNWSPASRYRSAGQCSSGRARTTDVCVTPESNQTSSVSASLRNDLPPQC